MFLAWSGAPTEPPPEPMTVSLVPPPPKPPAPARPKAAAPVKPKIVEEPPAPKRKVVVKQPSPIKIHALAARPEAVALAGSASGPGVNPGLSDGELAGAATVGSGPPGGGCDMARRVQNALRRDPLVTAQVAQARSQGGPAAKAILVWNGGWVQNSGEDGKGLSAVREAILWEVGFAPKACRAEPVHGLVLLSLNGGAGRLALGAGQWRWSDLLALR
jgi:hypothetical protein